MTKFLALFTALIAPGRLPLTRLRLLTSGATRAEQPGKPLSWLVADEVLRVVDETRAAVRQWASETLAAAQPWAALVADPAGPSALVAPDLAVAASSAPLPQPVVVPWQALVEPGVQVVAAVEHRFADRWPEPRHARLASALFLTSVTLICAGLVGAVSVAAPRPLAPIAWFDTAGTPKSAPSEVDVRAIEAAAAKLATGPGSQPSKIAAATPPVATAAPAVAPEVPKLSGALPAGKGMYIWLPEQVEGGNPHAIISKAKAYGLTHLYVRTGSSIKGFYAQDFLNQILPVAHAHGIRVYGWDFPYFRSWGDDVHRSLAAIRYTTPDGHRIDGFSPDIETPSEGTVLNHESMRLFGEHLRSNVGPDYPLIATIPRPSPRLMQMNYPFWDIVKHFDAISPMVYWQNREPGADVAGAIQFLAKFGKPIHPIGQAYDGAPEGGPPGVPSRAQLIRFMQVAEREGAASVSFWSWQHANQEAWDAIRDSAEFRLETPEPNHMRPGMVRSYQHLLTSLGFEVPASAVYDDKTRHAVMAYQRAAKLPETGVIDETTRKLMLTPFRSPLR